MKKTIHRMMSIMIGFVLLFGSYSRAQATRPDIEFYGQTSDKPRVYAYYYLWWSSNHWRNKLGPNYPHAASAPIPLPAVTDADGCNAVSNYSGNQLLDVPVVLTGQDQPGLIEQDIRDAKSAGITGFWLNWAGEGTTTQTRTSVTYTPRLAEAFAASTRVGGFTNWVSYKVASLPPVDYIINDLNFLYAQFSSEPSWERIDGRPVVTFTGSRRYSDADLMRISNAVRDRIFLVGDESRKTLTDARLALFDGLTYYWSTQDPYGNPQSFAQIKEIAERVHAAGKPWYAPLNPGYNSILLDGGQSCIPRRNGETLRTIWNGNAASNPDGWGMISWNEIAENTHIRPMQKWGNIYVNTLASLIQSGPGPVPVPPPSTAVPVPPTVIPPTTVPQQGMAVYDDTHPAWTYTGTWRIYSGNGPYANTIHYTTEFGATAMFTFQGPAQFMLTYTGDSNRGNLEVWVDGIPLTVINARTNGIFWQNTYTSPVYSDNSSHTVAIKNPNTNEEFIDVDAIQITTSP